MLLRTFREAAEDEEALARAMIADRAYELEARELMPREAAGSGDLGPWPLGPLVLGLYRLSGLGDLDRLTYLGHMHNAIEAARQPLPARLDALHSVDEALIATPRILHLQTYHAYLQYLSWRPRALSEARTLARMRCARAALAVERYRLAHGSLPESLDDVTPDFIDAVPLDPFTGEPLNYKRLDVGYTIYSVGENGADYGGLPRADIPFTVKR